MPRKAKIYHYIYKTTCLVTGRFYVGMHSTDNLEDGYLGSGKILGYSRKKHGDENHKKEILEMLPTREALKLREKEIVNEELLADPLNMNLKYGGEGGWERYNKSIPGRAKRSQSAKLVWDNEEFRTKNIPRLLEYLTSATKNAACAEAIKKRKATYAERCHMQGERNSQFGTRWVTDGIKSIKIRKDELDKCLTDGYRRGRR